MNGLVECTMCLCQTFMFAFMPTVLCFSGKDPLPYFLLIQAKVYFHVSSVFPWQHPKCSLLDGVFNIHLQFNTPDTFKNVYNFCFIFAAFEFLWLCPVRWTSNCTRSTGRCVLCKLPAVKSPSSTSLKQSLKYFSHLKIKRWMGHRWPCLPMEEGRPSSGEGLPWWWKKSILKDKSVFFL